MARRPALAVADSDHARRHVAANAPFAARTTDPDVMPRAWFGINPN